VRSNFVLKARLAKQLATGATRGGIPFGLRIGRFCGDFRPLTSWILVSADVRAF
jgi:hypothetical protein